jgi:hypothetical protein
MPVMPVPQNGSRTMPPGLQAALMHCVGMSKGNAAKCGPRQRLGSCGLTGRTPPGRCELARKAGDQVPDDRALSKTVCAY